MTNQWAARKANQKRDRMDTARSMREMQDARFSGSGFSTKREVKERPATAERRERVAIYGKFNPKNPISECCSMMVINHECTGCGDYLWWLAAMAESPACDMARTDHDAIRDLLAN